MAQPLDGPTFLYRFFDAGRSLLYVGITADPPARWSTHKSEKAWWPDVAKIEAARYESREEAEAAEMQAIRAEAPMHNVRGGLRRRKPAKPNTVDVYLAASSGSIFVRTEPSRSVRLDVWLADRGLPLDGPEARQMIRTAIAPQSRLDAR